MKHLKYLKIVLLVIAVGIVAAFAPVKAAERIAILCATEPGNCVESWNGSDIVIYSDAGSTQTFAVDGATGVLTLANGEAVNNSTDGFIGYTGGQLWSTTTITPSNGQTITPTIYTVYNLDSSGAVTITLAACTEGGPVILAGDDANTITIADSNIRTDDGGVAAIGQYDLFVAICVDSEWLQIANPTNS